METWRGFWEGSTTPKHRGHSAEFYQLLAQELKVLFHGARLHSVLEIGCGNGALYPYLGLEQSKYRGVDFSASMLGMFRASYPDLDLVCAEGASYRDRRAYDLIFSNAVMQYFDVPMLRSHLENCAVMTREGSVVVLANVLWRSLRFKFWTGELQKSFIRSFKKGMIEYTAYLIRRKDPLGFWHNPLDIKRLSRKNGFEARVHGGLLYPYRFHMILTKHG